jgi:hypothetical protein
LENGRVDMVIPRERGRAREARRRAARWSINRIEVA